MLVLAVVLIVIAIALMRFNLTALREPGRFETVIANRGRHFLVRHASSQRVSPRPPDTRSSAASGGLRYSSDCSICDGSDGRTQTPTGRWMS
jgi:hypothetical protein